MKKFKNNYSKSPRAGSGSPSSSNGGSKSPRNLVPAVDNFPKPHFMSPKAEAKPIDRNKLKPIGNSPEISMILERPAYSNLREDSLNQSMSLNSEQSPSLSLDVDEA